MSELFITVVGGLIVLIFGAWLGLGGSTKVRVEGGHKVKKTGKLLILISALMIIGGLAWAGSNAPAQGGIDLYIPGMLYGVTLAGYGVLLLIVGKIVAWWQRY
jgi:hypothetical protein